MSDTNFETDEFLKLLTDALRAGPGSPQWHDAIQKLRARGATESDEYRLLCTVRERLESGREYRAIKPGPGFTRKVMDALDRLADRRRGLPTATIIAIVALVVVVGMTIGVLSYIGRSTHDPVPPELMAEFTNPLFGSDFRSWITTDWKPVGRMTLAATDGLRIVLPRTFDPKTDQPWGGGVATANPIPAEKAFAVEAIIRLNSPTSTLIAELFITDQETFDEKRAGTSREVAAGVRSGQVYVALPGGSLSSPRKLAGVYPLSERLVMKIKGPFIVVESGGKQLFAGRHGLSETQARTAGVRFLLSGWEKHDTVTVESMKITAP